MNLGEALSNPWPVYSRPNRTWQMIIAGAVDPFHFSADPEPIPVIDNI